MNSHTRVPTAVPADTRMMQIVHDALRRDFDRAVHALADSESLGDRGPAVAQHLVWMADFLEMHHHGEDAALWPTVAARDPRARTIVETMASEHAHIEPLIDRCRTAATHYIESPSEETRTTLLGATRTLRDELAEHLEREEQHILPLAAATLSADEWNRIEQEQFIKPKPTPKLAMEAHWVRDGLDADRSDFAMRQVPFAARIAIKAGFTRRYRKQATACWGVDERARDEGRHPFGPGRSRRTIAKSISVDVIAPAPIDAVWSVISDVTRVGEWSGECRQVQWLGGATEAVPGARFAGSNRVGGFGWTRENEVLVADAPHTFVWRTVPTRRYRDSSEWTISLREVPGGTQITQSYRLVKAPKALIVLLALAVPSHRDRTSELRADLTRLGQVATLEQTEQRLSA